MEKDIQIGPETQAALKFNGGIARMEINYAGVQMKGGAYVEMSAEAYAQMLKDAIPGKIDDTIIDLLIAAMKATT